MTDRKWSKWQKTKPSSRVQVLSLIIKDGKIKEDGIEDGIENKNWQKSSSRLRTRNWLRKYQSIKVRIEFEEWSNQSDTE